MKFLEINDEKILIVTLYGVNRSNRVLEYHKKVMVDHFGLPVNYIQCPFPGVSHGYCMNQVLKQTLDSEFRPDYYWFLDNDAIILKKECVDIFYNLIKNKVTIAGQIWQSNHKLGPNGMIPHPYISQACLLFSSDLYDKLGRPDCDHFNPRSDTAEEITYFAKEKGYCIAGFYPSFSVELNTDLDNGCRYGLGNIYGPNLSYHCSQANNPKHEGIFIETCEKVLNNLI